MKIQFLFSFKGLCPSDPLTRGFAPGPRWGLPPRPPPFRRNRRHCTLEPHSEYDERSVHGGHAALCQITLITCLLFGYVFELLVLDVYYYAETS